MAAVVMIVIMVVVMMMVMGVVMVPAHMMVLIRYPSLGVS